MKLTEYLETIDGILWDMDGVIVNVESSYREAIRRTAEVELGQSINQEQVSEIKQTIGLNNDWDATYTLVQTLRGGDKDSIVSGLVNIRSSELYIRLKDIFQNYYLGSELYVSTYGRTPSLSEEDGLIKTEELLINKRQFDQLKQRFAKLGIVTGRPRMEAEYTLDLFQVREYFDRLVGLEDTERGKPDPAPIQLAILNLDLKKTIYIGDSPSDVAAAKVCNVPCVYIGSQKLGDFNFPTMDKFLTEIL